MFRQIKVQEPSKRFFRPSPGDHLKIVTHRAKPAPYLATRCLLQLAHEGKNKYPLAAPIIQNSTYMDGILSAADNITTAKDIQ
ncbi:hypothetical protein TNCT_698381 [Trichonephila clavata]|uniref:Uncharacterized protein n=1 Tax=Trichonephila clavata TaxID=2740835 RepID=A0A8X6HMG7_TRICU|nr:hypothetical protein TNCT_698381 [Trichonephila clavata]